MKIAFKRIFAFIICIPYVLKSLEKAWIMTGEIYNKETLVEIEKIKQKLKGEQK